MTDTALQAYSFSLDSAVAEWLTEKEKRTGSQKTLRAYEDTMGDFRAFLGAGNYDLLSNPIDVARLAGIWAAHRVGNSRRGDTPVSPSTYNQRLAILSSWYTFVQATYHLEVPNPITSVKKRPVQAYAAAVPLAPETVEDGLETIDRNTLEGLRNYAILAVALFTGHRASELVGLPLAACEDHRQKGTARHADLPLQG